MDKSLISKFDLSLLPEKLLFPKVLQKKCSSDLKMYFFHLKMTFATIFAKAQNRELTILGREHQPRLHKTETASKL